jgi:putative SOS response-associated peptidase YedK
MVPGTVGLASALDPFRAFPGSSDHSRKERKSLPRDKRSLRHPKPAKKPYAVRYPAVMCGRYASFSSHREIASQFNVETVDVTDERPRYNVAPTDNVKVIVQREQRSLEERRWGLVPHWEKNPADGAIRINARVETVAELPAFRDAFARRRCIVPADGFYEWKRSPDGRKQAYFIRRADGGMFAFAGLRATWGGPDPLRTCAIITTEPNKSMARLHNRMPAILPPDSWDGWLEPENDDLFWLQSLLTPAPDGEVDFHPVSKDVGNVGNDGPWLIERSEATEQGGLFK